MKRIIIISILVILGAFTLVWLNKNSDETISPAQEQTASIEGCYEATLGKDVYTLTILSEQGEKFDGTLQFKNFQKDSSSGTYSGTYKNGILLGDYSFNSEGVASVMQVIFKKSENGFVRGYGDMNSKGTHFVDINKIDYDSPYVSDFRKTECKSTQS